MLLAKRIKEIAPYRTITKENGPTIQDILDILEEINPIIFSEASSGYRNYRSFNLYPSRSLSGYNFKNLCQTIYLILVLKKNIDRDRIFNIATLCCFDYSKIRSFMDTCTVYQPTTSEPSLELPEEISLDDVTNATNRAINTGANNIPDGMLSLNPLRL